MLKSLVFRIPEALKKDLKMALLKNGLDTQHTFEAVAEAIVAHDKGEKIPDAMRYIFKRSETLSKGA
jgi:hypothetical protein